MTIQEIVDYYLSQGLSLIPIRKGTKQPAIPAWKRYQKERASREQVLTWIKEGHDLAVVCGKVSGNLAVIDHDLQKLYEKLFDKVIEDETLVTKTGLRYGGERGYHVFVFTDSTPKTKHFAQRGVKIDIQGEGAYVLVPPSLHHSGVHYEFAKVPPPPIKHWHGDFEFELLELIKEKIGIKISTEKVDIQKLLLGVEKGYRDNAGIRIATYFRRAGLSPEEVLNELVQWNRLNRPPLDMETLEIKVKSAFAPEKPYAYQFVEEKKARIDSPGKNLEKVVFEQVDREGPRYLIFNKSTPEVVGEQKHVTHEGVVYSPIVPCVWNAPKTCTPYKNVESLWREVRQFIYDHLDMAEDSDYDLLTAWVFASWVPERWKRAPYIFFYGPAASGKTWGLEILHAISLRGLLSSSITPAALFRLCDSWRPTLFLDEAEIYVAEDRKAILHLLNAGYRKGQYAIRTGEPDRKTGERKPQFFKVFGFKALAGTKEFAATLMSRNLVFHMSKAVRKVRMDIDEERAEELRAKLLMYRFKTLSIRSQMDETLEITGIDGRLRELFTPLISVAPLHLKDSLIKVAKHIGETRKAAESASIEALVFSAIVRAHGLVTKDEIAISQITEIVNAGVLWEQRISDITVGRVASKLGFKKIRLRDRRGIKWDRKLVLRLMRRYPIDESDERQFASGLEKFVERK